MSKYRYRLPQLNSRLFLTDGGLETTLVFHEGIDLPCFAAFDLLKTREGTETLRKYFHAYVDVARRKQVGIVLETPTWHANPDWGAKLGYDARALEDVNRTSVGLLLEVRAALETSRTPIVISGNLGPRGDGYKPESRMTVEQAAEYHAPQIQTFAATDADMVAAFTMNYVEEAAGITLAARAARMPIALSFTLETDGRLPSGDTLAMAISRVETLSDGYPVYYMINCAHPTHFEHVLSGLGPLASRVRGLRANASRRSHAELDASTSLDIGNPQELGQEYLQLRKLLPALTVLGGCCGTDHRHVEAIAYACA
ncbi:MAG: homocysteine S-methyltransferase family protein [Steroidobacteraceae bacterium]|nr:homocysteine S-methyltransferase family protein [Steroidobacteraceae bacterium]